MIAWLGWSAASAATWDLVVELRADERFALPSESERVAFELVVADLAREAPSGRIPADAPTRLRELGLELVRSGDVAWIVEEAAHTRGFGLLALRLGELEAEVVLQAPHPFSDLRTGVIASEMFDAGRIRAVWIATAHRDAAPGADPSATPDSALQAVTIALSRSLPSPLFVQLHGFDPATAPIDVVISEGATRVSPAALDRAAERLATALEADAWATGATVPALAARKNAQGAVLVDRARFLHVEMSRDTREALARDATSRDRLAAAVVELASGWTGR